MPRKPNSPDYEARAVKSAERVLDILVMLVQHQNGLKLRDISNELNIPVSSLYAILNTMKQRGFIEHGEGSLLYRINRKVYQLVPAIQPEDDLVSLAIPVMDQMERDCQETISLSVRVGDEIVFIGKRSSTSIIQVVNALGSRLPAHASGSGKVMMAYLPEAEIDRIFPNEELPRFTANTITTKTDLKKALDEIRKLGYAYDNEESIEGVWAVAGCIHDQDGRPIAATSIVVPVFRVDEERSANWSDLILKGAAEITNRLGVTAAYQDRMGRTVFPVKG